MADAAFKASAEAMGLQIFNTTTKCVETWNGSKWLADCAPVVASEIEKPTVTTTSDQFAYNEDSTILGNLYQWGRYPTGYEKRGGSAVNVYPVNDADYDATTGQIVSGSYVGIHLFNTSSSTSVLLELTFPSQATAVPRSSYFSA